MKQMLIKTLKVIVSDVRQAAVPAILLLLVGGSAGLLFLSQKALAFVKQTANTPTPLWATILLTFVFGLYLYLIRKREIPESSSPPTNQPHVDIPLDAIQVKILNLLFEKPRQCPEDIAQSLSANLETIRLHLTKLKKQKMVKREMGSDYPPREMWSLDQDGRCYVDKHK